MRMASLEKRHCLRPDIPNGTYTGYYPAKDSTSCLELASTFTWHNGGYVGQFRVWHCSGGLKIECHFDSLSRRNGQFVEYHANGTIKEQGFYQLDCKDGTWLLFDEFSNIRRSVTYKMGIHQLSESFRYTIVLPGHSRKERKWLANNGLNGETYRGHGRPRFMDSTTNSYIDGKASQRTVYNKRGRIMEKIDFPAN